MWPASLISPVWNEIPSALLWVLLAFSKSVKLKRQRVNFVKVLFFLVWLSLCLITLKSSWLKCRCITLWLVTVMTATWLQLSEKHKPTVSVHGVKLAVLNCTWLDSVPLLLSPEFRWLQVVFTSPFRFFVSVLLGLFDAVEYYRTCASHANNQREDWVLPANYVVMKEERRLALKFGVRTDKHSKSQWCLGSHAPRCDLPVLFWDGGKLAKIKARRSFVLWLWQPSAVSNTQFGHSLSCDCLLNVWRPVEGEEMQILRDTHHLVNEP